MNRAFKINWDLSGERVEEKDILGPRDGVRGGRKSQRPGHVQGMLSGSSFQGLGVHSGM